VQRIPFVAIFKHKEDYFMWKAFTQTCAERDETQTHFVLSEEILVY